MIHGSVPMTGLPQHIIDSRHSFDDCIPPRSRFLGCQGFLRLCWNPVETLPIAEPFFQKKNDP